MTATVELDDIGRAKTRRGAVRQRRRNRPTIPASMLGMVRTDYRCGLAGRYTDTSVTTRWARAAGWREVMNATARCIACQVADGAPVPEEWVAVYRLARDRAAELSRPLPRVDDEEPPSTSLVS